MPPDALRVLQLSGQVPVAKIGNRLKNKLDDDFTFECSVHVKIVVRLAFELLTPSLQFYIIKVAARSFQRSTLGSRKVDGFTNDDLIDALSLAEQEDSATQQANILVDNNFSRTIINRDVGGLRALDFRFPTAQVANEKGLPPPFPNS